MRPILGALIPLMLSVLRLHAAPVLNLNPSSEISGTPGQSVGWGFTITNDTDYLVVESFGFQGSSTSLGTFTDFSQYNFIDVGPAPDESPTETQLFSLTSRTGIGSFQISPSAQPGITTGAITMTYDLYSSDPVINGGTPIGPSITLSVPASIVVNAAPVPEPSTFGLLLLLCIYGFWHWPLTPHKR